MGPGKPGQKHFPGAEAATGEVVLACLREKTDQLTSLEEPARQDEYDAVHRMRVAVRTLRSTLKTFGILFEGPEPSRLDTELRWLGEALGGARDAEVLDAQLSELLARTPDHLVLGPVRERLELELAPRRAAARKALTEALDTSRYPKLIDNLRAFIDHPPLTPLAVERGSRILPRFVDRSRRRVRRRMREAFRTPPGDERDTALHEARKTARQARYAAEAVIPVGGAAARQFAKEMKTLQDTLGVQHDRVVLGEAVEQLGMSAHLAGENAFTYGLLHGYADGDARSFEDQVRTAWKQVGRARRKQWMRGLR